MSRFLIIAGIVLVIVGLAWPWASRLGLGRSECRNSLNRRNRQGATRGRRAWPGAFDRNADRDPRSACLLPSARGPNGWFGVRAGFGTLSAYSYSASASVSAGAGESNGDRTRYRNDAFVASLPIRLTPMTATCRVPPLSRVKLGIGWSRGVARDAEQ